MSQSVVDLQDRLGNRFRISHDPACDAEHKRPEPEQLVIRCRTGAEIYPHGGSMLVVELEGHRTIRKRLDAPACCRLHRPGDDFAAYVFDVADFEAVAVIVKPYRRRQMTAAQRDELRARFQANVRQKGPRIASDGRDGPEALPTKGDAAGSDMPPNSPASSSPEGDGQESSDTERDRPAAESV